MLIDVTVKVPEERVGDFYAMYGRWLSGEPVADEAIDEADEPRNWTNSDEDLALAHVVWGKLSPNAEALFSLLISQPGRKVSGEELAGTLGIAYGKAGVAGVLAWPARHCAAVNRTGLWSWEYRSDGEGAYYWVEPEIADLFKKVQS